MKKMKYFNFILSSTLTTLLIACSQGVRSNSDSSSNTMGPNAIIPPQLIITASMITCQLYFAK